MLHVHGLCPKGNMGGACAPLRSMSGLASLLTPHHRVSMLVAGASETEELYHVLTHCMMVRRLKKDVLSQLPPKRRTQVRLIWISRRQCLVKTRRYCQF